MSVLKATIMDEGTLHRTVRRISYEIVEKNKGTENICLVGIKRRGEVLAQMIAKNIKQTDGAAVPCGSLDISLYRDDLNSISESEADTPVIRKSCLPFEIVNKNVIIVDDVLYTGRTVRSAIDAVFTMGRPKAIRLAILIDRGHRELPIRADYIGKSIPTSASERVSVMLPPYDSDTGVVLYGIINVSEVSSASAVRKPSAQFIMIYNTYVFYIKHIINGGLFMEIIYKVNQKPKFGQLIIFALQQLLAILAATIAVPAIVGNGMSTSAALFGARCRNDYLSSFHKI